MGKKIFVSYKYADDKVENYIYGVNATVRDYVDKFEKVVDSSDDIYKGEHDDEDLSHFTDDTIWDKLKNRIYDSSVTIVFLSPGMKDMWEMERDQWIPWEISYSLKETSRTTTNGKIVTSHSNAMLAVVLPDTSGSYSWYLKSYNCCARTCTIHQTSKLFQIIRKNKFNRVQNGLSRNCDSSRTVWTGTCSYIESVKWNDFIADYQKYVNKAIDRQENIDEYKICKEV